MKIEMLEQMTASYLKNCEGCLITQTNWSISDKTFKDNETKFTDALKDLKTELEQVFSKEEMDAIFKKSTNDQFISQCEIDVVGLKFDNIDKRLNPMVYLYDTAFHEQGLHYKDSKSTVLKKIIRAYVIADVLFKDFSIRIGFVSPKCDKATTMSINHYLNMIVSVLYKRNSKITIDLYLNNQCDVIVNDLVALTDSIADTNDLFVRSIKLLNLSQANQAKTSKVNPVTNGASSANNKTARGGNKAIVESIVQDLIKQNKLAGNSQLLADLQDKNYAKVNFNLSTYAFMIENSKISADHQNRFYPTVYPINGKLYRVCSQWIPERMKLLQDWYKTI